MLKRLFDVVISAAGLVILSPIWLVLALIIRVTSPGPVVYRATRVGQDGREFRMLKFRSMVAGADQVGPEITTAGDRRVTSIGRVLRRTKLDELPQLVNVLRGDMSLVGPRPEDPRYVALYTPAQRAVLKVRPGVTSLASIKYRHEEAVLVGEDWEQTYIEEVMPAKLEIDLDYVRHPGLFQDVLIIIRTVIALFR